MNKILIILLVIIGLFIFSAIIKNLESGKKIGRVKQSAQVSDKQISYNIIDEIVIDAPIKTQVSMVILVSGQITEPNLNELLNKLYASYASALAKRRFKFHTVPTSVYIYAYISIEHYNSSLGQWIAMLMKGRDKVPFIKINQAQVNQIGARPEDKFGLPEEKIKEIRRQLCNYDEKSWEKAEEIYALPQSSGYSKEWARTQLLKQPIFKEKLFDKYSILMGKKYDLSPDQLKEIMLEGARKDWPENIESAIPTTIFDISQKEINELMEYTEQEIIRREQEEVARQNRPLPQISTQEDLTLNLNEGTFGVMRVGNSYMDNDSLYKAMGGPPSNIYFDYKNYYYKRGFIVDAGKHTTTGKNTIFEITIFRIPMNFSDDWMVQFRGPIIPSIEPKESKTTLIRKFGIPDKESGYTTIDLIYKKSYGRLIFSCNKNNEELERIILDTIKD